MALRINQVLRGTAKSGIQETAAFGSIEILHKATHVDCLTTDNRQALLVGQVVVAILAVKWMTEYMVVRKRTSELEDVVINVLLPSILL